MALRMPEQGQQQPDELMEIQNMSGGNVRRRTKTEEKGHAQDEKPMSIVWGGNL